MGNKKKPLILGMFVFLDIETTGFDGKKDQLLEIAAIRWDGEKEVARFETLVRQPDGYDIPPMITGLTGISNEMCENNGIDLETAIARITAFIDPNDVIVGHNISFDIGFLNDKGAGLQNAGLDTFLISVLMLGKNEVSHALEMLSLKYGIAQDNAHRAMSDVEANIQLYILLHEKWHQNKNYEFEAFVRRMKEKIDFPESLFFLSHPKVSFVPSAEKKDISFPAVSITTAELNVPECFWTVSNTSVFLETATPEAMLQSAILQAESHQKQLCIAYPLDELENALELFEEVQKIAPHRSSVFFGNPDQTIDPTLWEAFLNKAHFKRYETIVLMKVFRAKQEGSEAFLKFMGEEWLSARTLFHQHPLVPEPTEDIVFLPFSQTYHCPIDSKLIILRAENLETLIEEKEKIKLFEKRLAEDFPLFPMDSFSQISQALRSLKGENKYSLLVYESEFKFLKEVKDALLAIETNVNTIDEWALEPWKRFFSLRHSADYVFCIELFPDNALAFILIPKFLQDGFDELLSCADGVCFLGKAFPKDANGLKFTFNLPAESIKIAWDGKYAPVSFENYEALIRQSFADGVSVVVSVNSKKAADEFIETWREECAESGVFIAAQKGGSTRKIRSQIAQSACFLAVGTPSFLDGLRLEETQKGVGIIPKLSFDPPNHAILKYRREGLRNDFAEFVLPRSGAKLHKELRRIPHAKAYCIADPKLHAAWAKSLLQSVS